MSSKKFPRNPWAIAAHHRNSAGPIPSAKKEESRNACKREVWQEEIELNDSEQQSAGCEEDGIAVDKLTDKERWEIQDWLDFIDSTIAEEPNDK
jgi:hypothetical protein